MDLNDPDWKIYTQDSAARPHTICDHGSVSRAFINQGCVIDGKVKNSVLFTNVKVEKDAVVNDAVVFPNVEIGEGAVINRVIIAEGIKIAAGAVVGDPKSDKIELIAKNVR